VKQLRNQKGLTLIELMIVIAVIGVLLGIAIPTYQSYQASVRMSKASAHFDEAIRLANTLYAKGIFEVSIGKTSSRPSTSKGWVELFNANGGTAPLGGLPYVASATGDASTGAIGVASADAGETLLLYRPEFYGMQPMQARVDANEVVFTNL
jgi:prepilin-type N-terminal cleavage/methylation domain-containing protein